MHFFEVDLPEVQGVKKRRLVRIFVWLPGHVAFVPPDLNSMSLGQELTMYGLDTNRPTLFILEAVT